MSQNLFSFVLIIEAQKSKKASIKSFINNIKKERMTKYMHLFRGGEDIKSEMPPDEMQAPIEKWKKWMGEHKKVSWLTVCL